MAKVKGEKIKIKSGDFVLVFIVMALVVFGIVMVFSASYYVAISEYDDPYHYLKSDIMWATLGLILMIFTTFFNYKAYYKLAPVVMIISVVLLLLLFTPLGFEVSGATRWIKVGGLTVMPGEICKISCIIFVSWFYAQNPSKIKSFTKGILPILALTGIVFFLIYKQPNLSTAVTVCGIIIGIMFVAGMSWVYFIGAMGLGAVGVIGMVLSAGSFHLTRMMSFLDPWKDSLGSGYQVIQSLLALGSGGLFGVGLGKSIQKTLYLPEPQNDFIFAIIGEELGFIGCLALMLCYLILIWRGMHIAMNAPDMFSTLLAAGITIMLALQVILNIAVVTASMPPTGITLPLVSYGGNALMLFMGSMGILLNISRHSAR